MCHKRAMFFKKPMTIEEILVRDGLWPSVQGPRLITQKEIKAKDVIKALSVLNKPAKRARFFVNPTVAKYMGYEVEVYQTTNTEQQ